MENLGKAKAAVDQIVSRLETKFRGFNTSETWKAGSLGHGTVVPGHYDIDLVLYSRDINPETVVAHRGFGHWIGQLKVFIDREFNLTSHTYGSNPRSVQFECSYQRVTLSVDLLVSPYWSNPRDFYQFLRRVSQDSRDTFTVCASKWQVQFFQDLDNDDQVIKEYIQRAKDWRNRKFGKNDRGRPSSYLMSLLVVKAYEYAKGCNHRAGASEVTRELIRLVKNVALDVHWDGKYYKLAEYSDLLPVPPRVIDPANPANNVWQSGIRGGDASVLVSRIGTIDLSQVNY